MQHESWQPNNTARRSPSHAYSNLEAGLEGKAASSLMFARRLYTALPTRWTLRG